MNTPSQAISIAKNMISSGYVYGYGFKKQQITEAKINQLAKMYPSNYSSSIRTKMMTKLGKIGIDCSGFVCEAFGISHIGSSQLKSKMKTLYKVTDKANLQNGMLIWRKGHVGLIEIDEIGEAWILEAKGTFYDLCRTKFSSRGSAFTYYGQLNGADYSNALKVGQVQTPIATTSSQSCILEFIDISHHNTIDLSQAATKYKDVIIRAGYRGSSSGKIELDKKFLEHTQAAIANSMKYGFYFFDQSINETEAIQQADFMADLIAPLAPTHPLFIDSEYANQNHNGRADGISKEQRTRNLVAFCKRLKERGYIPGVYASENWFQTMVDFNQLKQFPIWCARYSSEKPRISEFDAWQYGSAYVPGSSSPIDVNRLYTNWNDSLPASEIYFCRVTASVLNIRNKPSTAGDDIGDLKNGTGINVYQMQNGWCKISESSERWCSYKYIKPTVGVVSNCNKLTCRQSPGKTGKAVFYLSVGNQVNILRQDETTMWYFIEYQGRTGYVSNKYITI